MRELKPSQKARSLHDPVVTSTPLVAASSGASSLLGLKKLHRLTRDDAGGGAAPSENSSNSQFKATSNQRNALLLQRASKASASPLPVQHRNSDDTRTESQGANGKWIMEKKQQHPAAYHLEGELQIEAGSATTTRIDEFSTQGSRLRSLSLYEEVVNHHHPWSNGGGSRDWSVERKASSDSQKRIISSVKYFAAAGNRRKDKEKDAQEGWEGDAAATARRRDLNLVKQRIVSEESNNNAHPEHRDLHGSDPGESMFQTEEDEEEEEGEEELSPVGRQTTIWSKRGRASSSSSRRHEGSSPLLLTKQSRATTNRSKLHTEKSKPETATMPILEETDRNGLREGRRQTRGGGSLMKKKTTQHQYRDDEPPQQKQQQVLPVNPPVVVYNELELLLQQGCGRPPWERSSNKKNHEGKPSVGNPVAKLVTKKKKKSKTTPAVQRKRKVNTAAGASSKTGLIFLSQRQEEEEEEEDYYLGRSTASPLPLLINKDYESHHSDSTDFVLELAPSSTAVVVSSHAEQELGSKRSLGAEDRHGVAKEEEKTGGLLQNAAKIATTQQLSQAQEKQMHRTLSQKYRPKIFDELVGQGMVVKTLSMAILKDKVAPAYLFTGPSGTGKTTTARIFAAALNCLASESRPCGNCQQCGSRSHQNQGGGDSDVKEIDAASTNVDLATMRSSIMQQNFSSTYQARYKVFIVEGCHLLSTDIWNAFLKLLEEPPSSSSSSANVVFILITTESEQLPLTVISR
jgi:hypothetical protein